MSLDNYTRLKVIGKGSYGEVWLARNKKDKKQYVLKKMDLKKASKRERKAAEQEAKLLSKLKHPNIVSYRDSFETDEGYLYISMQYCEGGDLYNKLKEQKGTLLEERQVVEWFVQISMALQYMHERNILHRDLKTQNIFLTKSKIIKVGDLGIARVLDSSSDMATTLIGTPYYMSPELFSNKPYNHKSDVWALGCCVYEMTTLKHAFNAKDMNSLVYKILRGKMPVMPRQYSVELVSLLKVMLHQDPEKRPSVNRVLRDPFIKKNITLFLEGTRQRHKSGGSSARSMSNRVVSAGALAKSSESQSEAGSGRSVASVSRVQLIGGGDGQLRNGGSPTRYSADVPVPLAELEPISEHAHPIPSPSAGEATPSNARIAKPVKENIPEIKVLSSSAGEPKDVVDHRGEGLSQKSQPKLKDGASDLPSRRRARKSRDLDSESVTSIDSARSSKSSVIDRPKLSSRPRPLPPPPVEVRGGLPIRREELLKREETEKKQDNRSTDSSKSSGTSASSRDPEDGLDDLDSPTPRSLPNLSARERRRQNISTSQDKERPSSARRLKLVRPQSMRTTKSEKSSNPSQGKVGASNSGTKGHHRQPSIAEDSSSSSNESTELTEVPVADRSKRRENREMKNFISLLDTTLRLNKENDQSDEESKTPKQTVEEPVVQPVKEPSEHHERRLSMPSAETLGNTGRLMERIRLLRKDCMQGVGYLKLRKAYDILERIEEDEVEPKLVELLGQDCFDLYAGKIWQLKFCEESAFGFKPS